MEDGEEELVKCLYKDAVFYIPRDLFSMVLFRAQHFSSKKYVRYKEGAEMYSISVRKFVEIANKAEAVDHVDKIALVDTDKLDEWIKFNKD